MSNKTGLFFFLTFCCIIIPISGIIIDHYCIMEIKKKIREIKDKVGTLYPKNYENSKNSNSMVQFNCFLYKKECSGIFSTITAWCQGS